MRTKFWVRKPVSRWVDYIRINLATVSVSTRIPWRLFRNACLFNGAVSTVLVV
jgi:hypothetical protein